ncbi:carbohydrate sulfotransferase 6-like [Girardinichthys multiradiatus]|uniref:carbohydrate sulfotransferase 6-like n=1 Tax=Girardinichthys multiradiatus TaxID=208333 RepID=UPI001FAE2EE6|nr:carbohydrate sulfotransferase 6-like [Girardinichthys multiradiatus]XP_047209006.1 carbohydrate sulfotransferase 6-like [Girardinichthys multiradiatus]
MSRHYRFNLKTVISLVILHGVVVVLFCSWYVQIRPCNVSPLGTKTHILLLSSWRSGSSFLGQILSQHPSVFYLSEPAWHVWTKGWKSGKQAHRIAVRDLLRDIYKCDFSVLGSYFSEKPTVSSLFMWTHSRALCSPPACPLTATNDTQCRQACGVQGLKQMEETCRAYSHLAIKEVRFFELESLYPLLQDPDLDLRIIHLVRDPRAVMKSREKSPRALQRDNAIVLEHRNMASIEMQNDIMQKICQSHVRINERAILDPPVFLEGRYKMIRYEDVAHNPLKEMNNIYKFVGLKTSKKLEEWIYRLTHGNGKGTFKEAFQITSRNATEVSQAWRTVLPYSKVRRIQEVCKEAKSLLGYRTVYSEEEQKRLETDLVMPQKFTW